MNAPTPGRGPADHALGTLVTVLGEQREALGVLVYRLTVASLLVADGNDRYLARAGDDVISAADRIGELDLARAVAVAELAAAWDLDTGQPTLEGLVDRAPAEYRPVLAGHLDALRSLTAEAAGIAAVGERLASEAGQRVADAVSRLEAAGGEAGYGPAGPRASPPSAFFDGTA